MVADSFVFDLELIFRGAVRLAARFEYIYFFRGGFLWAHAWQGQREYLHYFVIVLDITLSIR